MYQMKALSSLYVTFILLGLLEASHQRNMRWHFFNDFLQNMPFGIYTNWFFCNKIIVWFRVTERNKMRRWRKHVFYKEVLYEERNQIGWNYHPCGGNHVFNDRMRNE